MPYILAALVTTFFYFWSKRYTNYVDNNFNTQAVVDPDSVPNRTLADHQDTITIALTQAVQIPQAQIASGFGDTYSPNRLNPSVPPLTYGNSKLDTPTPIYYPPSILPMT